MQVRHIFPQATCRSEVEGDRAFFLRNTLGDFVNLSFTPQSRYHGWFINKGAKGWGGNNGSFLKIIESILPLDFRTGLSLEPRSITNTQNKHGYPCVHWEFQDGNKLAWNIIPERNALRVSCEQALPLEIVLDVRNMYTKPEQDRKYNVQSDAEGALIEYLDPLLEEKAYLYIKTPDQWRFNLDWHEAYYPWDDARHSEPTRLYVFRLGAVQTTKLSLGYGSTEGEARANADTAEKEVVEPINVGINYTGDTLMNQVACAKLCAERSLHLLRSEGGIFAGLPWFHQVWSRDELIAALGVPAKQQQDIIRRYLSYPLKEGELPTYQGSPHTCADGVGWLCLLVTEYGIQNLPEDLFLGLYRFLNEAQKQLVGYRKAQHGLISSLWNATWMDTIGRDGFALDIQCGYALVLELLHTMTKEEEIKKQYIKQINLIRQYFYKDGYLFDRLNDSTKRPNVFLAYLLQPGLLHEQAWISCFNKVLDATRLDWGGLASIDKSDPRYQPTSTGQDNISYHNGDSWFFVNNLAGLAMHRLSPRHFGKDIVALLTGSTEEILFKHMIGQPGEIASASNGESFGCGIQGFSAGAYIAFVNELETTKNKDEGAFWEVN